MQLILDSHIESPHAQIKKAYVFFVSTVVGLGGILFGYDLVIISGAVPFFTKHFSLSVAATGWAVGCINLGAATGAILSGWVAERVGRKTTLLLCAFLFAVTGLGTGWASSFEWFIISRLASGVAVGTAALVCPMYVAEIAPVQLRGRLVALYQLAITLGLLFAYISNYLLLDTGNDNWRWMFSSQSIPAMLFLVGLFFVPESPRWLIGKHRTHKAKAILIKIGGSIYAEAEAASISDSFQQSVANGWSDVFSPRYKKVLLIGVAVAVFSQAAGQNSLFSYSNEIFAKANMAQDSAFLQSILLGVINFLMTFVAIKTVDKTGRRKLLMLGSVMLCLDVFLLAICFWLQFPGLAVLLGMLAFIGVYAATLGPVTWVLLSEIFPNRVRGTAMAATTLSLWIANFLSTSSFPVMKEYIGLGSTFLLHGAICMCYFFYVRSKIPETKEKSLEELELLLR